MPGSPPPRRSSRPSPRGSSAGTGSTPSRRWLGHAVATALLAILCAVGYCWLLVQAARGRARLALAAGLLLVVTPYLAAWYTAWIVPLAALEEDRVAQFVALGFCAYLLPQTIPV